MPSSASKFGHNPHQVLTNALMSGGGTLYPNIDPATLTLEGKQYH
jgi:hypothetical protein